MAIATVKDMLFWPGIYSTGSSRRKCSIFNSGSKNDKKNNAKPYQNNSNSVGYLLINSRLFSGFWDYLLTDDDFQT